MLPRSGAYIECGHSEEQASLHCGYYVTHGQVFLMAAMMKMYWRGPDALIAARRLIGLLVEGGGVGVGRGCGRDGGSGGGGGNDDDGGLTISDNSQYNDDPPCLTT